MTDDLYEATKRQVNKAKIEDIDGKENGKKEADEEQERLARREKARKEIEEYTMKRLIHNFEFLLSR